MQNPLGNLFDIVPGFVPVDMQTAANPGDYVSLKNWDGICFVLFKAAGTAGDDPTLTITQAQDVAGTGVKNVTAITDIYTKQGTLTAVGAWAHTSQAAAATVAGDATSAESQGVYYTFVPSEALDADGGFDCIKGAVADVGGNAQLGCLFYILVGPRFAAAPENLPSVIVD
jgi:hypothetical protein